MTDGLLDPSSMGVVIVTSTHIFNVMYSRIDLALGLDQKARTLPGPAAIPAPVADVSFPFCEKGSSWISTLERESAMLSGVNVFLNLTT